MNSSGTANESVICVDKLWLNFKSAFLKVADRHVPLIQKRVRGVDNCPWMTGQIKKDIRQRDYFLKKTRKSSRDEDWLAYKSMRNLACVAWRFWLGALSNKGGRGQTNREEIGAEAT